MLMTKYRYSFHYLNYNKFENSLGFAVYCYYVIFADMVLCNSPSVYVNSTWFWKHHNKLWKNICQNQCLLVSSNFKFFKNVFWRKTWLSWSLQDSINDPFWRTVGLRGSFHRCGVLDCAQLINWYICGNSLIQRFMAEI